MSLNSFKFVENNKTFPEKFDLKISMLSYGSNYYEKFLHDLKNNDGSLKKFENVLIRNISENNEASFINLLNSIRGQDILNLEIIEQKFNINLAEAFNNFIKNNKVRNIKIYGCEFSSEAIKIIFSNKVKVKSLSFNNNIIRHSKFALEKVLKELPLKYLEINSCKFANVREKVGDLYFTLSKIPSLRSLKLLSSDFSKNQIQLFLDKARSSKIKFLQIQNISTQNANLAFEILKYIYENQNLIYFSNIKFLGNFSEEQINGLKALSVKNKNLCSFIFEINNKNVSDSLLNVNLNILEPGKREVYIEPLIFKIFKNEYRQISKDEFQNLLKFENAVAYLMSLKIFANYSDLKLRINKNEDVPKEIEKLVSILIYEFKIKVSIFRKNGSNLTVEEADYLFKNFSYFKEEFKQNPEYLCKAVLHNGFYYFLALDIPQEVFEFVKANIPADEKYRKFHSQFLCLENRNNHEFYEKFGGNDVKNLILKEIYEPVKFSERIQNYRSTIVSSKLFELSL